MRGDIIKSRDHDHHKEEIDIVIGEKMIGRTEEEEGTPGTRKAKALAREACLTLASLVITRNKRLGREHRKSMMTILRD